MKEGAEKTSQCLGQNWSLGEKEILKSIPPPHPKYAYIPPQFWAGQEDGVSGRKNKKEKSKRENRRLVVGRKREVFSLQEQKLQCMPKREKKNAAFSLFHCIQHP